MGTKKRKERRKQRQQAVKQPPGSVVSRSSPLQAAFLAAYSTLGVITKAAEAAHCSRESHTWWMTHDPDYPAKFQTAQDEANDCLEAEARRRAVEGVGKMKFWRDKATGEALPIIDPRTGKPYIEHDYSDRLIELLLKAHLPEKYVERSKVETTNIDGGEVPQRVNDL